MGACEIGFSKDGKLTREQIRKEFNRACEEARDEHGHNRYSGSWNTIDDLKIIDKVFNTSDLADKYCSDNCYSREAIAVKYKDIDYKKVRDDKNLKAIQLKIQELYVKLRAFNTDSLKDMKSTKSQTIACPKCESRINRSYLKSTNCPVCQEELKNKTTMDKLNKLKTTITELEDSEKQLTAKLVNELSKKSDSTRWLVFGLAAS